MTALFALLAATTAAPMAAIPVSDPVVEPQRSDEIVVTGQRTEGSDDYGVRTQRTATRLPLSQRETPQSVSVVTRAQIDDFQLNDVNALLATVPGVNVLAGETDRFYYSARGFDIQTFQIDGVGLPFSFGIQTGSIDTAMYDRIEVVRGAPGLLSPTGNPSAVINFIRKRPYRELRTSASAQYGSFDNLRLDADVSVPLTADGSVRARAVGAYLDTDSHLDRYGLRRWTGYGIVEADLGANTVISAGYGHQDHKSRGAMWGANPLYYTDGTRIDLDRSANYAPDWSSWGIVDRQIFGDVTHDLGNGWTAKFTALRKATDEDDRLFYVTGNPDRTTGLGIGSYPGAFKGETRNLTLDGYVGGPVSVGGRAHDVMFGVTRGAEKYLQYSSYDNAAIGVSLPLGSFFQGNFPEPTFPTPYTLSLDTHTRRETVYGLVRLNLADPFKLMLGGNATRAQSEGASYGTPTDYNRSKFLPFVGATYDLTANVSAYASFTTIFNPQSQFDVNNQLLDPIEGDNLEAGLKGEWFGGRFNASAAVFQARQKNTAEAAGFDTALGRTLYRGVDAKSQGIEVEIAGQPATGMQVTGGFTVMRVRGENDQPVRTFVPRNTGRLNVTYSPPALPAVKVGTSIQYQGSFYLEPGTVSSTTGQAVRLTQGDVAVVDLLARYELTDHVALSANLRNVTNAKYLTALTFDQGQYAAPRTILGTISVRY
ncbi:TonB-dependent siderophore receptor [Sphingomonas sp. Leaf37]|uniref:TonB-dependent siderophore receptor n=1 Tax=Sphingomonas sp. Leaf37 TaxID=2876552 RepID=UPI001E2A602A|nr:TonB-dependent siderophore receptor [Sphingomonas sp. Leaf37]